LNPGGSREQGNSPGTAGGTFGREERIGLASREQWNEPINFGLRTTETWGQQAAGEQAWG